MARTDKNESNNKLAFLSLAVTIVLCICIAIAIFYVDLKIKEEILHLRGQIVSYGEEVAYLRSKLEHQDHIINQTVTTVHKIKGNIHSPLPTKPVAAEDDYYYDNYDYEDDDEEEDGEGVDETTAAAPLIGENVAPSQAKIMIDTNDTVSVRPKRHVYKDEILEEKIQENTPSQNNEERRRYLPPYSSEEEENDDVKSLPLYQEHSSVRLRHRRSRGKKKEKRESDNFVDDPCTDNENSEEIIAAHYGGHTRHLNPSHHVHYKGNYCMYHPFRRFTDWAPSTWVQHLGMNSFFNLQNGILRVTKPGLYLVYAQIFYADGRDTSGYKIYHKHNNKEEMEAVAQCITTTHSRHSTNHCNSTDSNKVMNRNTCFTSIMIFLQCNDELWLQELEGERFTMFESYKSFFGLIRLRGREKKKRYQ